MSETVILVCHSNDNELEGYLTVGEEYKVKVDESNGVYDITNDMGMNHGFTIEPDSDGLSYRDWFTVKGDEAVRRVKQ